MTRPLKLAVLPVMERLSNSGFWYADTGSRIAKGKMAERAAVIGLGRVKVEGDFISLVVDGAATLDLCGDPIPGS